MNLKNDVLPYQPMLKESINRFFAEYRRGVTDFADFSSIFSRMLHTTPNPPIQILWFYAALDFHTSRFRQPSRTISAVKDLFRVLVSCSATCGSMTRIAALAPLLFELCRLMLRERELKSEVESLVEAVVGYISILCGNKEVYDDDVAVLEGDFVDLITVWMVDDCDGDCVKGFFPFVSDRFRKGIEMGCEVGFLAGVVMCEAFLLKMCLGFEAGISKVEMEEKLLASAVQTITGFRSFHFLDTLFRMMLEPVLPVISLLGSENEVLLKDALYNSVMTMEYSFINPQAGFSLHADILKDFAITWLFVAELAVQSAREKGDQGKTMSYVNAFCRSCMPIQLINWVTSQRFDGRKISRPNVSTPIALIKWLLVVEEQGLAVFGDETAKHHTKDNFFTSRTECLLPVIKHFFNKLDKNLFLNSIHEREAVADKLDGDIEMLDNVDTTSFTADDDAHGSRKRKEGIEDDNKTQIKFMRCQFHENSVRENSIIFRQQ
ncbi:uncharacterized protein LOC113848412 [Abrus precatorius]|uniref:Uncharacterized protein LOC113848412 n=1 Tax=Abrus precatorius TaxID=3816 RepID=A0A8B8JQF8_ABRPR|nr:uncharacterized protein LOC113848412 [Abrus precatorius]